MKDDIIDDEKMVKEILNKTTKKTNLLEWKENIDIIMSVSLEKLRRKVQYDNPDEGLSERDMRLFSALTKCYIDLSRVEKTLENTINEKISKLSEVELTDLEKRALK